jgi:hypothetical protein
MLAGDIHQFLESKDKILLLRCSPDELLDALRSIKVTVNDDMDQNGWQCDWWCTGKFGKQKLNLSGSAWYGNARIEKTK